MTDIAEFDVANAGVLVRGHGLDAWLAEAGELMKLAGPLIVTQLAQMAIMTTDVLMLGHIGKTALGVFRRGGQFIGKTVSIAGTIATGEELAAKFTSALGEQVVYRPLTTEQMRASGPVEFANSFQFYSDASGYFTGVRDLEFVRELNPELQTLDSWLTEHKNEIPLD